MKELLLSIFPLIGAIAVSILVYTIGTVYSFGYSIYMSVTLKKWNSFFIFWWRLIDGYCATIANLIYEIAYALDLGWNVNGEIIEDMITAEENTTFSNKNISVSASVGKLESEGKLNKFGKFFSKLLSFAFNQRQHALDAWAYTKARMELKSKLFQPRKLK